MSGSLYHLDAVILLYNQTGLNFCKAFWGNGCMNLGDGPRLETA